MPSSPRKSPLAVRSPALAAFRLIATFILACYLLVEVGLALRSVRDEPAYVAAPPVATRQFPFLGINVEWRAHSPAELDRVFSDLAAAGFGWARVVVAWDLVEPRPGEFDWRQIDPMLDALAESGLEPVVVLNRSPAWARAPQDQNTPQGALAPPADPQDFARFAAAFAARYGDQVRYYQIWDEPNIAPHWGARHIEPVGYAQLLTAAAGALRAADADAKIITAALAPTSDRGHLAIDEVSFLRRLYAAGAAASFDVVAVQPFGFGATPDATPVGRGALNFRRAQWVRAAMLAAGDGETPILLTRYGWNRSPASPWGTVTPADQVDFAVAALDLAYEKWPWVMGQAWAIDQPDAPPDDPRWGFALTPALTEALQAWQPRLSPRPRLLAQLAPWQPVARLGGWLLLLGITIWRGYAAARYLPWACWGQWLLRPSVRLLAAWGLLIVVYYLATWPPLILLCWLAAAWFVWLRPTWGLALALMLLPLHIYHKEVALVDGILRVPPAYALLMALLPAWLAARPWRLRFDMPNLFALGWLALGLTGLGTAWYLPGALQGLLALTLAPLLLYAMLRTWATTPRQVYQAAAALATGGLLAALIGLIGWGLGGGTVADGMRRLVGPTFSPNHAALYLVRTLPLLLGLVSLRGAQRGLWWVAALAVGAALLLTGSRGGLLLGLPVGLMVFWVLRHSPRDSQSHSPRPAWPLLRVTRVGLIGAGVVLGAAVGVLAWGLGDRLVNVATVAERFAIWRATLALWLDYYWLGTGPGGFYWTYPAYIPLNSPLDPNLRHPHNVWMEFAAQAGVAGLIWLLAAGYQAGRALRQQRHHQTWARSGVGAGLIGGLCAALAHAHVDAWQALPDLAAWNWAAIALLVALAQTKTAARLGGGR